MPPPDDLARFLGWASLALGAPMAPTPGRFDRAIGVKDDRKSRFWTRVVGVREFAAAAGILGIERPRPVAFTYARVAGDVMDLALLAGALRNKPRSRARILASMGAVAGIGAADLYTSMRLSRAPKYTPSDDQPRVMMSITVRRPIADVRALWHEWHEGEDELTESSGGVRFVEAPRDQGTEIHVNATYAQAGGAIGAVGAALKKLTGEELEQKIRDELRRFKQVAETGIVIRSEGTPEGPSTKRLLKQRPAQPLGGKS
jgi:uncharacterized membrane protein